MSNNEREFKTKWGFILACVGSAVGMANVWGFPYKLGSSGGGAFLVPYLIFIALFSYVGLSTEYAVGRRAKTGTLGAYKKAWEKDGKTSAIGRNIGFLPLAGSMCIAIGYAVIISYVLKALLNSITGELMTVNPGEWFESFALHGFSVIPLHLIIIVVTLLTLVFGSDSIEKSNKVMMPLFFILFLFMAVRILLLPGALQGYKFMLTPEWSMLKDPKIWVFAMGQAFFSLSVTGSGMIVYGAYLSDKEDVVGAAKQTAIFDTIAAFVAACVMIPACFAYGIDPAGGPGLLFVTIPTILQDMPGGRIFAIVLYLAVVFGGISSLQNMFEVVLESICNRFPVVKRNYGLALLFIICMGIGVFMESIDKWGPWMDIVSIYIIPIGATLGAISWFWVMKKEDLLYEINKGREKLVGNGWYNIGKYVYVPLAALLCIYALLTQTSF